MTRKYIQFAQKQLKINRQKLNIVYRELHRQYNHEMNSLTNTIRNKNVELEQLKRK